MTSKVAAVAVVGVCWVDRLQPVLTQRTGFHEDLLHSWPRERYGTTQWFTRKRLFIPRLLETVAALQAFRKRHADAQRVHAQLSSQPTTIDLTHYRSILKNKAIVDDAEKLLSEFKPVTYEVNTHVKAIETFEAKAVGVLIMCTTLQSYNAL